MSPATESDVPAVRDLGTDGGTAGPYAAEYVTSIDLCEPLGRIGVRRVEHCLRRRVVSDPSRRAASGRASG